MKEQHYGLFRSALLLPISMLIAFASPFVSIAQQRQDSTTTTAPSKTQQRPKPAPSASPTQQGREAQDTEVININVITMPVTVTDAYGRYISGLDQKAFKVFEDKVEQQIEYFSDEDEPVSIGILFDVSGSMDSGKIKRASKALTQFIEMGNHSDEYFLIAFSSRAQLVHDRTGDGNAVLDKLKFIETGGNTAFYDAVWLGIEKVLRGAHKKRALLLISDGQDNDSRYNFSEVLRLLNESGVVLYSVCILGGDDPENSLGMEGPAIMDELSFVSGGRAIFLNILAEWDKFFERKMGEFFERIGLELRHQYRIGYQPKNYVNDGKWRKLRVEVTPPRGWSSLFVRSREGYYANLDR